MFLLKFKVKLLGVVAVVIFFVIKKMKMVHLIIKSFFVMFAKGHLNTYHYEHVVLLKGSKLNVFNVRRRNKKT